MHLWLEIVVRELLMLVTLGALGAGPAAFLGRRFDPAARLAMTPVLGLCLGTCVFTTLIWFTAARHTYWLLPILAIASVALALQRRRRTARGGIADASGSHSRVSLRDALGVGLVCVVVAAPFSYTMHERNSVGPTGYLVWDSIGYTGFTDGMVQQSIREAMHPAPEHANLTQYFWTTYARTRQNVDVGPLSANLNELVGLSATDTQGLFLIVFLVVCALGAFAALRYSFTGPGWVAVLAGVLFAGPLYLQLMADGSQAAICGLSVILPFAIVIVDALREQRIANVVVLALMTSGLMALYPVVLPGVVIAAITILLASTAIKLRRARPSRRALARALLQICAVAILAILFDVVAFTDALHYWQGILNGTSTAGLPEYELPVSVLPGWLLQTRQFFFLTDPNSELLSSAALPGIFILVILLGLWRRPSTLALVPFVLVFSALAVYSNAKYNCSYCVDRNMLPVATVSIALLACGVAALAALPSRWLRAGAMLLAAVAVGAAGSQTNKERQLFADNSYFPEAGTRSLISALPHHAGPVNIEGYGQDPHRAAGELPLTYFMVSEHNHGEVSLASEYTDYDGLAYFGRTKADNAQFSPGYRYVLTRFGGLRTGRRVIARAGPMALEERTAPLDATLISGVATPLVRLDKQGLAAVVGRLHLIVAGGGSAPAWVLLRFSTVAPATAPAQPGVRVHTSPTLLSVCVRATGTAPVRRVGLTLQGSLLPGSVPDEPFAEPEPPRGIELVEMRAVSHCSPDRTP